MLNQLLDREYVIDGDWYQPSKHLESIKSVIKVELIDIRSNSGDWNGVFFQHIGIKVFVIRFSQKNRYPKSGYNLYTDDCILYKFPYKDYSKDYVQQIIKDLCS